MVTVLRKGDSKKNIKSLLEKLLNRKKPKGIDISEFVGTILKEDPLKIQKRLKDEWEIL